MPPNINLTSKIGTRTGIVTSAGTLLSANDNRKTMVIQNLNGTDALFVKLGTGASTTDFDFILKAGAVNDDGLGGIFAEDTLSYTGIVSVTGTTVRCTATDL